MGSETALRERKKHATREALSWAAVRLAIERGLSNLLVEDIAAEVGVSPRTFNNYFSSKAEAIASRHLERAHRTAAALRARPLSEPLWEAITRAVLAQPGGSGGVVPDPRWTAGIRLMVNEPSLIGEFLRVSRAGERALAEAIAQRTGTDPDRDLYPRLVAGTVNAATQVAIDQWVGADPPGPLEPILADALKQLAAGLPLPPRI